ncbi:MAG: Phosphate regulon transcriptional regulatory protein PhoB [Planctomycetes bacterium]|nr:Phosphate regulon transcriptional regulatory protein PhoB [Planctomycetota bacterium]
MNQRILIIEDEPDIIEVLKYNLEKNHFSVASAASGEAGLKAAGELLPDLVLLDLMLPGIDGLEVCRRLRDDQRTRDIPVVMLTAKGTESDVVVGLTLGADDYIVKPFNTSELMARIKAVLRRTEPREGEAQGEILTSGPLRVDLSKHVASLDGAPIELTLSEFKLLTFLMKKKGRVFTRDQLLDAVVGPDVFVTARNIDVHVAALRKKLGKYGGCIITVRGVGYRFEEA